VIERPAAERRGEWFTTTLWSVVLEAGASCGPRRDAALERLCRRYWPPVYAFIRGRGYAPHDAQDLTQDFLLELIARDDFAGLDRRRGKFRSFLLACLHHFLAKNCRERGAQKRGGGTEIISWDAGLAEAEVCPATDVKFTPDHLFDRRWAMTVMDQALASLKAELTESGKAGQFEALKVFLTVEPEAGDYDRLAAQLDQTAAALATAVHRLRRRFREKVRETLAQTVSTPLELEEELRYLREVLAH